MKRLVALLLTLTLATSVALADILWPEPVNDGQRQLHTFVDTTNTALAALGEGRIDMKYELYSGFASLGMDGVELPDAFDMSSSVPVEMYFTLGTQGIHSLQLRLCEAERFTPIAAACLHASSPNGVSLQQAQAYVKGYADIALRDIASARKDPASHVTHSFEEEVNTLQGSQPRAYFAYYPDQYGDGVTWLQMTLIFPLPGSSGGTLAIPATPAPEASDDMYQGYFAQDSYSHLEIFLTPTPEPDSAAME